MSKQQRERTPKTGGGSAATDGLSRIVEQFEELSGTQAIGIVLGLCALMVAVVYRSFLFGDSVLLYTDIGSDSVNIFYPLWYQQAKLWAEHSALHGFSLETVMGMPVDINLWDPFQWIVISGGPESIPARVVMAEIMKSLLIATFGFFTFRMMGLRNITSAIGALCFAFSGYVALGAAAWYVHSSEVVFIVLALWAAEYALNRQSLWYAVAPLSYAFIAQNGGYLTIYLTAALVVYALIRTMSQDEPLAALKRAGLALATVAGGLLISYSAISGVITTLTQSGRAEALKTVEGGMMSLKKDRPLTQLVDRTELTKVVQRAYSTNAMGIGDTYRGSTAGGDNYLEGPLLYMGLPMLLFFPLFGVGRSRKEKLLWGAMLGGVLMMIIFPWFRYAFWGFKLDYFREFTMLIGVFLLLLAMMGLDATIAQGISPGNRGPGLLMIGTSIIMVLLPFVFAKPAALVDGSQRTASVVMMLLLSGSAIGYVFTRRSAFLLGVLVVAMVDLSMNANATITKRSLLTTSAIRSGKLYGDATLGAIQWIKQQDADLYRIVKYTQSGPAIHASLNDAMVQEFNGLIGYLSFHNKYYLKFMSELGCADLSRPDEAKWVARVMTRPFLASALGARYFVTKGAFGFQPEIFPAVHSNGDQVVQRSNVTLPLVVVYDRYLTAEQFRTFDQGKMDLMLYKAVVLDPSDASGLAPYDLAADTTLNPSFPQQRESNVTPADFVRAANERNAAMKVQARTTASGLAATVTATQPGLAVISVPYDPSLRVTIDGTEATTVVANFGFIGVKMPAGRHEVKVERN
ncbi:MAG: YfhO family protein [Candidatus Kapabacteria bacterium]|nr:YfhO family protein [Candidatus Kapabacteria bacterium]